jgi:hypothetical protein
VAVAVAVAPFLNSVLVAEEKRRRGENEKKSMTKNSSGNQLTPIMQGNMALGGIVFMTTNAWVAKSFKRLYANDSLLNEADDVNA